MLTRKDIHRPVTDVFYPYGRDVGQARVHWSQPERKFSYAHSICQHIVKERPDMVFDMKDYVKAVTNILYDTDTGTRLLDLYNHILNDDDRLLSFSWDNVSGGIEVLILMGPLRGDSLPYCWGQGITWIACVRSNRMCLQYLLGCHLTDSQG